MGTLRAPSGILHVAVAQYSHRRDSSVTEGWEIVTMRSLLLLAMTASLLFAQGDSGRFTGTVTDATGGVVPGAIIKILNEKTG